MLTDPQDLPGQQEGSGKRGERPVEPAGVLACPAGGDLKRWWWWGGGGSAVLDKQQNSCPHWEKDEGLGGAPSEGPEPELGSASVIWIRKTLG